MATYIAAVVAALLPVLVLFVLARKLSGGGSNISEAAVEGIKKEIGELKDKILAMREHQASYIAKAQFQAICDKVAKAQATMEKDKASLREMERKLETAQKEVEEKESGQQRVRSASEEGDAKLVELINKFEEVSKEAISLEQSLAQSLKSMDALIAQLDLTDEQKALLTDLSDTLTAASGNLRDLIFEYQTVNERLNALTQQHADLEEEYTKLVEQQLGQ